ncbi:MAG TPA: ATP-binding protein [Blastocatellia bacterium]|nr:ATP-binding protein [Blastocatellia bacterium]
MDERTGGQSVNESSTYASDRRQAGDDVLDAVVTRESRFVILNLGALLSLVLVHVAVLPVLGSPSSMVLWAFGARIVMLIGELRWLRTRQGAAQVPLIRAYANASLLFTIAFAFVVSIVGGTEDSHYSILMVTPIIAAAFRFSLPATICVAAVASAFTVLQVWLYETLHPPIRGSEFFEAATVALIFLIVGFVVWQLVNQLRSDSAKLAASLVELERTRDRLVEEEKLAAIGRLSSAIAHEIRNPVAMISSSLATAARGASGPELRDEMLSIASEEAARLEKLTTDFLSYAWSRPLDRRPVEMSTVLGYVVDLAKSRAADCAIEITIECRGTATVQIDQFQIHQALLNLVSNAIEATAPGGKVVLGCSEIDDERIAVSVENAGHAIPSTLVERVFEPFFTTKQSGTGLGLGISRNIVLAHGGDLSLTVNENGRVRFTVTLPRRERTSEEHEE